MTVPIEVCIILHKDLYVFAATGWETTAIIVTIKTDILTVSISMTVAERERERFQRLKSGRRRYDYIMYCLYAYNIIYNLWVGMAHGCVHRSQRAAISIRIKYSRIPLLYITHNPVTTTTTTIIIMITDHWAFLL